MGDTISYNASMNVYGQGHHWAAALGLFSELLKQSMSPEYSTYSTLTVACKAKSEWAQMLSLLLDMQQRRLAVDSAMSNALVEACQSASETRMAMKAFRMFQKAGIFQTQ